MSTFNENTPNPDIALPNETLTTIFNEFLPSTLATLSCVSHRFKAVAERMLYSSVSITDILTESLPVPRRTLRWSESIQQRTHLADATKKLYIRWQADLQTYPSPYLIASCEQVAGAVRILTSLESLEILLGPANIAMSGTNIHAIERIITGCRFPLLLSCSLGADWIKGAQPYTTVLDSFLTNLGNLRHLKLSDHHTIVEIPPQALPFLSSFRGSADAAASLLPGRPVQYLSLVGQDSDVNRENLPRMTHTSMPLRYLDLSAMSVRPSLLRNISTYLPTVESLRVRLALRHTLHYSFSGLRLLAGLSAVLRMFQSLSCLDLSPTEVDGVRIFDAMEEYALCTEWGRACPSLRRIIFPTQTEWVFDDMAGLWLLVQT